jgi:hypothetical protein
MPPRSKRGRSTRPEKPSTEPANALVALADPVDVYQATKKESEEGTMETAKVDIRKLQMLNDCINRTIEALNQVRLSVHGGGLSHSAPFGVQTTTPFGVQGLGTSAILGGFPNAFTNPYAVNPQIAAQMLGVPGVGLGHTAAAYGNPLAQQIAQQAFANPFAANQVPYWAAQQSPWTQNAWQQNAGIAGLNGLTGLTGLGHTGVGSVNGFDAHNQYNQYGTYAQDPYATARIAQTFPFVHWGYSPFGWPNV